MPATPITNPAGGESLVGIEPQLLQQLPDSGWRRRLNLFTGRALSVSALDNEQLYRSGLLSTLGQAVTPGTVKGLALTLNTGASDPLIAITPGYGIMAGGIDVILNQTLKTAQRSAAGEHHGHRPDRAVAHPAPAHERPDQQGLCWIPVTAAGHCASERCDVG
jgi:hypothetical protein